MGLGLEKYKYVMMTVFGKENWTKGVLRLLLLVLVCTCTGKLMAGIDPEVKSIYTLYQGTPVVIGQPEAEMSLTKNAPGFFGYDRVALNRITLKVDQHYKKYFGSPMEVQVKLAVERWDVNQNALADTNIFLKVFYNPFTDSTYISAESARFSGAYQMHVVLEEVMIDGVQNDTLPANLRIDAEILVDRYHSLLVPANGVQISALNAIDQDCNGVPDGIEVIWPTVTGALEYQLEWVYINNYGSDINNPNQLADISTLDYNFKYNSTRISTTATSYKLSLIFDQGYVLFRVRPVGVIVPNIDVPIFGPWGAPESGPVQGFSATYTINPNQRHEVLKNWQYSATYAEEGKKKEIVSYYDGSLRNRQTVTRINSDEHVIVGETIYDHQGRPAINVLPVPVVDPNCANPESQAAIQFYPNFNVNTNGQAYSRSDFDLSPEGIQCSVGAAPMDTVSGASQYYSPNNPDQNFQQAYVPDAHKYPFTQVEYTPDNTGRIRRQSGVGPEFQLGSGHESEYLYGQPNQLELDRLFGSEVGDALHYKKNVVIDAHGQASISYLDQEGRVIATALAGDAPQNLQGIASEAADPVLLTVNAFGNNNSQNQVSVEGNSLVFSTQLLVAFESAYTFDYNFSISPLQDECLPNICIDCVYELKLELVDECGENLAESYYQTQLAGKFSGSAEAGYNFHAQCANPLNGEPNIDQFTIEGVQPGSYSLNKRLTISEDAREAFIDLYLNDTLNNCIKTYQDFLDEAIENTDFSDCKVSCEACLEELGSLEDYVAAGNGTANDYYLLQEDCERICNEGKITFCEVAYSQMQMDMSPGGQYGEYPTPATPLSIYFSTNQLPEPNSFWTNPKLFDDYGNMHAIYVDMNGDSSKIYLEDLGDGTWSPAIQGGVTVKFDPIENQYYIYPHELSSTVDFVANFQFSWAKSLVFYHPEYCYYEQCIRYGKIVNDNDAFTSDSFDELMNSTMNFQQAVANGFLPNAYQVIFNGNFNGNLNNVADTKNWFPELNLIPTNTNDAWDPFYTYRFTFSGQNCFDAGAALKDKFDQYKQVNGVWRTMPEMAAYLVRCGDNYYANPPASCFDFGSKYNGVWDIDILNAEWEALKAFYRSEKQQLKQELADCIALKDCERYCGCIGNDNYNPYTAGMIEPFSFGSPSAYINSAYFQNGQPCGYQLRYYYKNKDRRFTSAMDAVPIQDANQAAYEVYLATGQCPVPFTLQHLLSAMAQNGHLDNSSVPLNNYGQLNALFQADNDFNMPGTIPQLFQNVNISGNTITASWIDNSTSSIYATLTLTKQASTAWDNITSIINLYPSSGNGFTAEGVYTLIGPAPDFEETQTTTAITGSITTFDIAGCSFANVCTQNDLGADLQNLISNLAMTQQFTSSSAIDIDPLVVGSSSISGSQTQLLVNASNSGNNLLWQKLTPNSFKLYGQGASGSAGLYLTFTTAPSGFNWADLANVVYFDNLISAGQHLFDVEAFLNNGTSVQLSGSLIRQNASGEPTGIQVGVCDLPTPAECQTPQHVALSTLYTLLEEALITNDFNGSQNIDLFASAYMETSLAQQFPMGTTETSSTYDEETDILTITSGDCVIELNAEGSVNLTDVLSFTVMTVTGEPNNFFSYQNFQIKALFDGGGVIQTPGYINGSASCLSLLQCYGCIPDVITPDEHEMIREQRLLDGDYILDNSLDMYDAYASAIDSFNLAHGSQVGDSNYVQKKGYEYFTRNGFNFPTPSFLRFTANMIPEQDEMAFLIDPDKFVANYGYGTNVVYEYERYVTATERYNLRAAQNNAPGLTAISKQDFTHARVARQNGEYLSYLESQPVGTTGAQGILNHLNATTNAVTNEELLYQDYANAYLQFEANQLAGTGPQCGDFKKLSPLYAIEDLAENKLFCSTGGMQELSDYVQSLVNGCPDRLPNRKDCTPGSEADQVRSDQKLYILYKEAIKEFNDSYWATTNGILLPIEVQSVSRFRLFGYSKECIKAYMQYLQNYSLSTNQFDPPVPPLSISEFGPCVGIVQPEDPCKEAFAQYEECRINFNSWAKDFGFGFTIGERVSSSDYLIKIDACKCVDEFCARLQAVMDSVVTFSDLKEFYLFIDPAEACKEPCQPEQQTGITSEAVTVTVIDDCYEMLMNNAIFTAQLNYENYINELTNELINQYNSHCMGVQETFRYSYMDKLYHFTLYYYDQAGNLIKTIPPAGVERLNTTNSNDALSLQIAGDRTNNSKTVFTTHRMATRYEYNSLNQLVAQSSPDTDPMDIFELTLPNGLHSKLITRKIQMVNDNTGYLAGEVPGAWTSAGVDRGYLYKTNDGGVTWNRVYGLAGSDLKKAVMLNATTGFAVGGAGIVLKTTDGGESWDMLNSWVTSGMITDLNDVIYTDNGSGNYTVMVVGNNGLIARSTDLQTFTVVNTGISNVYNLSSITQDNQYYYVTANNPTNGTATIYRSPLNVVSWTLFEAFSTLKLRAIDVVTGNRMVAAGDDGRIYVNEDITILTNRWKLLESDLTQQVNDVQYFDNDKGIALVNSKVYRTVNGGANWTAVTVGTGTENYHHLSESADGSSVLAVGANSKIGMLVNTTDPNAPMIPVTINTSYLNLTAGWIDRQGIGSNSTTTIVVAAGSTLYVTQNGQVANPTWVTFDLSSSVNTASVKDLKLERNGTAIRGAILTTDGKCVRFNSNTNPNGEVIDPSGAQFICIGKMNANNSAYGLQNDGKLVRFNIATPTSNLITVRNGISTQHEVMFIIDNFAVLAGEQLHRVQLTGGGQMAIQNQSLRTNPSQLNDIRNQNGAVHAIGNDGTLYRLEGTTWRMKATATNSDLMAMEAYNGEHYIVGESGYFVKGSILMNQWNKVPIVLTTGGTSENNVSENLMDIAVNGTRMYVVGQNGRVLYSPDAGTLAFAKLTQGSKDLYGVTAKIGNSKMLAVGDGAQVLEQAGASFVQKKDLFTASLKDVHFATATTGTVLGSNFTVRKTSDAGVSWTIVKPTTPSAPTGNYTEVYTWDQNRSMLFGQAAAMNINGTIAQNLDLISNPIQVTDVKRYQNKLLILNNTSVISYDIANNTDTQLTSFSGNGNAIEVFNNGSFAVAGNNGFFRYFSNSGATIFSASIGSENIRDLHFIDNIYGVAVGDNGAYYKTGGTNVDASGYLTAASWTPQQAVYNPTVDPYFVSEANQINIYTIAFSTATNAVFGGEYTSNFSVNAPQHCYVRTLFDPNSRYSARFFYDRLGRLVISQNARQYNTTDVFGNAKERKYSYTLYDGLGRVVEVGEKADPSASSGTVQFKDIFGTTVSDYYNPTVIDDAQLLAWVTGPGERREVTKSYYDETVIPVTDASMNFTPNPLTQRKRIVHVTYEEVFDGNDLTFDHATHYDYDIHGNVKTLIQDNRKMAETFPSIADQRYKRMDYVYDLVSGNVHRMSVQTGKADQWHHAYQYDADNRITAAYTTKETPILTSSIISQALENELVGNTDWQKDAKYIYYAHGPLARVEIGNEQLQGTDYVYNLQGWMKGVNATSLDENVDPGRDASTALGNLNQNFAKDVFGFSLHYFDGDYASINSATSPFASVNATSHAANNSSQLFNGNIRYMQTTLTDIDTRAALPMLNAYKYDQLNRLKESRSYESGLSGNEWNPVSYGEEYYNGFTYDAMGNIRTQERHNRVGQRWENLKYHYQYTDQTNEIGLQRNRLYHLNDTEGIVDTEGSDLDDQDEFDPTFATMNGANNYVYDEEGRLIQDKKEGIVLIVWRVDGKVKEIHRPLSSGKKNVSFDYDAMGNRIAKHVFDDDWNLEKSTYYILDAQGNQLSTYEHVVDNEDVIYRLNERMIYGSSRLGNNAEQVDMYAAITEENVTSVLGNKSYEFSNHLGNVLTVISDLKIPESDDDEIISSYRVGIRSTSDYSPFGVQLDGRTANSGDYRYGYQGSEADNEIKGQGLSYTTYFRQLDPRVGRWLSIDPDKDNWSDESPYVSMINNPVVYNDPDGDCPWCALFDYAFQVTVNLAKGDGIKDAFIGNVDFVSVGVNLIPGGKGILKVAVS
jgi:RHS repeat-associated protein